MLSLEVTPIDGNSAKSGKWLEKRLVGNVYE
jgi:hypothetical protein